MVEPQSFLPLQGNGESSEQGRPQTRLWWVPASNCKREGGGFFFIAPLCTLIFLSWRTTNPVCFWSDSERVPASMLASKLGCQNRRLRKLCDQRIKRHWPNISVNNNNKKGSHKTEKNHKLLQNNSILTRLQASCNYKNPASSSRQHSKNKNEVADMPRL